MLAKTSGNRPQHAPCRDNLIYALLVAVVVRGIRAGRVRAGLLLLMRVRVLLLRGVVVRVVRVQVRRVRAGRVVAVRPLRRRDGDLVLVHGADARRAFLAGDA